MRVQFVFGLALLCVAALGGCDGPAPSFVVSSKTQELAAVARGPVQEAVVEHFGTPNQLVGWQKFPIDYGVPATDSDLKSEAGWKLKQGRNLYMLHCLHCHGVSGDGNGPTAKFLNPRPRDYRKGIFKFTSTQGPLKPSRLDLKAILKQGIPGTSMPSFVLIPGDELDAIVEYVRWLSTRGEFESKLGDDMLALGAGQKDIDRRVALGRKSQEKGESRDEIEKALKASIGEEFKGNIDTDSSDIADAWAKADAEDAVVVPKMHRVPPTAESLKRGKALYFDKKVGKCVDCHGLSGRGDGAQTEDFMSIPKSSPDRKYEQIGLHDEWGFPITPRNLTRGVYRGGRRPVDIYRRIYAGIKGTPMPGFSTGLKEEDIWDLVNYVMSLPFGGEMSAQPSDAEKPATGSKMVSHRD